MSISFIFIKMGSTIINGEEKKVKALNTNSEESAIFLSTHLFWSNEYKNYPKDDNYR